MVVWCVFWGESVGTAFPFSQDLRALRARHLSVSVASSWDTEEEEREEEVGEGGEGQGGNRRGKKRETMRNESWEANKCSLVSVVDPMTEAEGWVMLVGV